MSISEGNKRRWAKVDPTVRSQIMTQVAKARWSQMTEQARSAHISKMNKIRNEKSNQKGSRKEGSQEDR